MTKAERDRKYYLANREKIKARSAKRRREKPEECYAASRAWALANRDRVREISRESARRAREAKPMVQRKENWARLGICLEEAERVWLSFKGSCELCGTRENTVKGRAFHIDHDHTDGHVRGVVCNRCNAALGKMDRSGVYTEEAKAYLKLRG